MRYLELSDSQRQKAEWCFSGAIPRMEWAKFLQLKKIWKFWRCMVVMVAQLWMYNDVSVQLSIHLKKDGKFSGMYILLKISMAQKVFKERRLLCGFIEKQVWVMYSHGEGLDKMYIVVISEKQKHGKLQRNKIMNIWIPDRHSCSLNLQVADFWF